MLFKNNKLYDILKWISLVALDAIGVAYEALANVWSLPYGSQIATTTQIISALIGALIGLSSIKYSKAVEDEDFEEEEELLDDRDEE